ncbi:VOC family protein [Halobacteriovorax sp. GB3]|uniref:VOC family protein n=1 Tax=Halobacteriovorax sp. GB3 TaxID=2719615 RepID=UPI002360ABA3|nr:VOC family protein [Halobacteriovorax sp. GB3]MDD0854285.1 VOC family protein [Halobacteriovorax sp. GB3]
MKSQLYNEAKLFLDKLLTEVETKNIDLKNYEIDHICFRVNSLDNYEKYKGIFQDFGKLLTEADVNGRPIATYKLYEPIIHSKYLIDLIELPAPKPGKATEEGFEHIEIVTDQTFHDLAEDLKDFKLKTSGLKKDFNQELALELDCGVIKFHHKSLEQVIQIEEDKRIMDFIETSKVYAVLKDYEPCISGTLPLDIAHRDSDLDILFQTENLDQFISDAKKVFGNHKDFSCRKSSHQGFDTAVINFTFKELPVELFAQNRCVYQQQANQHFLIEGRMLKIFGEEFKKKVRKLKADGIKTEPAFGEVFQLEDPYRELIEINKLSDLEISKLKTYY